MTKTKNSTNTKKKVATIVACGALALTLGTGVAFAANAASPALSTNNEYGASGYSTDGGATWQQGSSDDQFSLAIREVDGITQYSTDGGKTWSASVPDGFTMGKSEDGAPIITGGLEGAPSNENADEGVMQSGTGMPIPSEFAGVPSAEGNGTTGIPANGNGESGVKKSADGMPIPGTFADTPIETKDATAGVMH